MSTRSTKSNYVPTTRSWVQFTAKMPSGSPTSEAFPYLLGDYALGNVVISGGGGNSGHLSIQCADYWNVYRVPRSWSANYSDWLIQTPSGGFLHDMPSTWFTVVGSARFWLTDGSGSGLWATGNVVYGVAIKS